MAEDTQDSDDAKDPTVAYFETDANGGLADTSFEGLAGGSTNPYGWMGSGPVVPERWLIGDGKSVLLNKQDYDGDGLDDDREALLGTNMFAVDTDGDGLSDLKESMFGSNPLVKDTDGDGLSDSTEYELGTYTWRSDTDSDGVSDADEVAAGTNPLVSDTGSEEAPAGRAESMLLARGLFPPMRAEPGQPHIGVDVGPLLLGADDTGGEDATAALYRSLRGGEEEDTSFDRSSGEDALVLDDTEDVGFDG